MNRVRWVVALAAVVVALVVQVSLFPHLAWHGIVPNLCLLVVVAAALTVEAPFALVLGFAAGLTLDLAPPADHVAGRWALALTVAAFLAARVRQDVKPSAVAVVGTVAAASFAARRSSRSPGCCSTTRRCRSPACSRSSWSRSCGTSCSPPSCSRR